MRRNNNRENTGRKNGMTKFSLSMQKKLVVLFGMVLLAFLGLAGRLIYLNREKGDEYTRKVLSQQQYQSVTLPYKRGDILDTKGTKLAISEKVYNLVIDCKAMLAKEDYLAATLEALISCFPQLNRNELENYIVENPSRRYYVVAKKLSFDEISPFVEIQNNKKEYPNVQGVWFEEEYKRVYPNGSLASDVIGFTIKDDEGVGFKGNYGLEAYYNDILNGSNGREYGYLNEDSALERTTIPANDGYNLELTLDTNIQSIIEKHLKKYDETYKDSYRTGTGAYNVGCIIMDVNTGGILGMASYPNFDLNNPIDVTPLFGTQLLTAEGKVAEEETIITQENAAELLADNDVLYANLNGLWKNFCISNTYEPGSTAKAFTIAAGLESGKMSGEEYYTCNGALKVGDYTIKCHNYSLGGDGTLNVQQSLEQSCNVALMLMGEQIGKTTFLDYQDRFNFGLRTNIDLAGESRTQSLVFNEANMGPTELATSTFGQGYNVTMIQMISGFCSLINGGYYYEPHVVSKITTTDGALVRNIEPRIIKQTISESTSALIRQYCKGVVDNGTGKTARPAGYAIGGKTGTAEMGVRDKRNYVVSFMGYAPAENPEIAIYVVVDRPNVAKQDDAKHATRLVRSILTEVLPYLNIFMTEELSEAEIKELEELDMEIIMAATVSNTVSGNEMSAEESVSGNGTVSGNEGAVITNANGGDITSSIPASEDVGDTAPLTGVLLDPETGEPLNKDTNEDSPQ
ncbi:MAG: peptidoglycan D,D-transpeptidase FtsI family protein [Lachnospiraceae bacterium]|nr:penicillin-binding protein 2 [Lachnospiraceae bacterium]MDY3223065.1 penicillin-binding protein 2 [Lachnospiraceae bacterium]MDY4095884.1 penicillin-binding protein 2 [Lachnospiraceae bacterium]